MNKYYTPELSEFHVGFEFELRNSSGKVFDWEKAVVTNPISIDLSGMDNDYEMSTFASDIKDEYVRVKFLDREDIESFGFEAVEDGSTSIYTSPDGDKDVGIIFQKQNTYGFLGKLRLSLFKTHISLLIIPEDLTIRPFHIIESIKIKNKSELRLLLKQLAI